MFSPSNFALLYLLGREKRGADTEGSATHPASPALIAGDPFLEGEKKGGKEKRKKQTPGAAGCCLGARGRRRRGRLHTHYRKEGGNRSPLASLMLEDPSREGGSHGDTAPRPCGHGERPFDGRYRERRRKLRAVLFHFRLNCGRPKHPPPTKKEGALRKGRKTGPALLAAGAAPVSISSSHPGLDDLLRRRAEGDSARLPPPRSSCTPLSSAPPPLQKGGGENKETLSVRSSPSSLSTNGGVTSAPL